MKQQVIWSFNGIDDYNDAAPLVAEYNTRRRLAELGFQFDASDLMDWEVESFMIISQEIQKQEADKMKRAKRKGRSRG